MVYAMAQNNLGTAYSTLAEVTDKADNCRRAIEAYEAALAILTEDDFPDAYQGVSGNLQRLVSFDEDEAT